MGYWEFFNLFGIVVIASSGVGGVLLTVPYIVLRLRDARQQRHDPQLGVKVALHFLFSVGVFLTATGATVIVSALIDSDGGGSGDGLRVGIAFFLGGGIFAALFGWTIGMRTNDGRWPLARRAFSGIRFIAEALVFAVGLVGVLIVILSEHDSVRADGGPFVGLLLVWGLAWVVELTFLLKMMRKPEVPGLDTRCVMCGYDLRGSSEGAACPECGTLIIAEQRELLRPGTAPPASV